MPDEISPNADDAVSDAPSSDTCRRVPLSTSPRGCTLFISYCHRDHEAAARLLKALQARGVATWIDAAQVRLGGDTSNIKDRLERCDGIVQLLSPRALESEWVDREKRWALEIQARRRTHGDVFAILPIRLGDLGPRAVNRFYGRDIASEPLGRPVNETVARILEAVDLIQRPTELRHPEPAPREWPGSSPPGSSPPGSSPPGSSPPGEQRAPGWR